MTLFVAKVLEHEERTRAWREPGACLIHIGKGAFTTYQHVA